MGKIKYDKPYLVPDMMVDYLSDRGMVFTKEDRNYAINVLADINWYHLKIYFYPYLIDNEKYKENTSFHDGMRIYFFDFKLRKIIIEGSLLFEQMLKTKIDQILTRNFGFQWYLLDELFQKPPHRERLRIYESLERSKLPFAVHYKDKYILDNPSYQSAPPSWIAMELVSFDHFLKIFLALNKQKINRLDDFNLELDKLGIGNFTNLKNWLEVVKEIRNIACHNGRLWNAWHLSPKGLEQYFIKNKVFSVLYIIDKVLSQSALYKSNLKQDFINLVSEYQEDIPNLKDSLGVPKQLPSSEGWQFPSKLI